MNVQLVVASGNRAGQLLPITGEKFIIGRADDCHLKPRSELISRYHCAILVGEHVSVRDLGSKNGVYLNGERITAEQKLKNGDKLVIGPLEFFLHIVDDSESPGKLPAGTSVGESTNWLRHGDDDLADTDTQSIDAASLLDRLKSLNLTESGIKSGHSGHSASELLKKFFKGDDAR